jgi:general secretion pathway protein G
MERGSMFFRMRHGVRGRAPARGMTLIEIMVVITILGLIAAAVGVAVIPQLDAAKVDTSRNTMFSIESGLKLYYTRHGKYPDTGQGLQILVTERMLDRAPKDGFGNDFVYLLEAGKPTLISYGKDGAPGGDGLDADINNNALDKKQ